MHVQVLDLEESESQRTVLAHHVHNPPPFFHWVMASRFLDDPGGMGGGYQNGIQVAVGLGDNSVMVFSGMVRNGKSKFERLHCFKSSVQTMLYSMSLWGSLGAGNQIFVVAGTMFGSAFIWQCAYDRGIQDVDGCHKITDPGFELQGHQGAILRYCQYFLWNYIGSAERL